jgi:SOS-response transcriptional repressor LexA
VFTLVKHFVCIYVVDKGVNFLFMNTKHETILRLEQRLEELGVRRSDFLRDHKIESQNYNNWRERGIPQGKIEIIAGWAGLSYSQLKHGEGLTGGSAQVGPIGKIPVISWKAAENWDGIKNLDPKEIIDWRYSPEEHSGEAYVLIMSGEAMAPNYKDGDLLFIDANTEPHHNSDVIVLRGRKNKGLIMRRFQLDGNTPHLVALNNGYNDMMLDQEDTILGCVFFYGRAV